MHFFIKISLLLFVLFTSACNRNLTEEQKKEMWSKAQTQQAIIDRSGTKFNPASDKELAMRDAQTRLQTGGGLFKDGINVTGIINQENNSQNNAGSYSMPINAYLWKGALEVVSFMPLNSADPIGGTILTDWYSTNSNENERCKLNILISGTQLKSQNLKVSSFCQVFTNQKWINAEVNEENNIKLENAILNKAKKLRLQAS